MRDERRRQLSGWDMKWSSGMRNGGSRNAEWDGLQWPSMVWTLCTEESRPSHEQVNGVKRSRSTADCWPRETLLESKSIQAEPNTKRPQCLGGRGSRKRSEGIHFRDVTMTRRSEIPQSVMHFLEYSGRFTTREAEKGRLLDQAYATFARGGGGGRKGPEGDDGKWGSRRESWGRKKIADHSPSADFHLHCLTTVGGILVSIALGQRQY